MNTSLGHTTGSALNLSQQVLRAGTTSVDPNDIELYDRRLIADVSPVIDRWMRFYFRLEVKGISRAPEGRALLVANHEAGISFVQLLGMGARWVLERGTEEPVVSLMHDAMFRFPFLGNFLGHLGAVRACQRNAERALERNYKVFVCPGGNLEAFRPFSERFTIKFGGHQGWARLAVRQQAPVVPVVFVGAHETFLVLHDGHQIAQWLGLHDRLRVDTFPVFLGLPWGLGIGPLVHVPLPAKCTIEFLPPILPETFGLLAEQRGLPTDENGLTLALSRHVTEVMQACMHQAARSRRFPILG